MFSLSNVMRFISVVAYDFNAAINGTTSTLYVIKISPAVVVWTDTARPARVRFLGRPRNYEISIIGTRGRSHLLIQKAVCHCLLFSTKKSHCHGDWRVLCGEPSGNVILPWFLSKYVPQCPTWLGHVLQRTLRNHLESFVLW